MIRLWFDLPCFQCVNYTEHFNAKLRNAIPGKGTKLYTQVSLCFWQTTQGILGETMPLIRDLLNLAEMTAIHLSISQQSRRGGGGATLPKHDWLMSDVECKLIYSSLLCLERGRERRSGDETETDRKRLTCLMATAAEIIKQWSLLWLQ